MSSGTTHGEPRTTLLLVRHGQTVWHAENRYAGISDIDLTPAGADQAEQLAEWARRAAPDRIVCSSVRRAQETAEPSARATGLTPVIEPDLREIDYGTAEGRTLGELRKADPDAVARFLADPVAHHFPRGEPPAAAAARATAALRRIAAAYPGEKVLVVAHNTVLRLCLCRLTGLSLSHYRTVFPKLRNAAVTELSLPVRGSGLASLHALNVPTTGVHPPRSTPAPRLADGSHQRMP